MKLYYLKGINSKDNKKIIPFKKDEILIGRAKTCNHVILDPSISRRHALFKKCGDEWVVKNVGSNDLFVDNKHLKTEEEINLRSGSIVSIGYTGNFCFRFGVKISNIGRVNNTREETMLETKYLVLEKKLRNTEASYSGLLNERKDLVSILDMEKKTLQEEFLVKEKELEKKLNDGVLIEKSLMEEKEKLAENLKNQFEEMKMKHDATIINLENKLKMEEDIKTLILKEKEELANQLQVEKDRLEKRLIKERKELEEVVVSERMKLQNKLSYLEDQRMTLEKMVKDSEHFYKLKEEEQENIQKERSREFENLKDEKEKLVNRLNEVESNLEEKLLLTSTLEGELMEKQKLDHQLKKLIEDKQNLEEKLSAAIKKGTQISELEESLKILHAQKLSLENEITSVSMVSKSAREEVVESISNVLENEFQCSICNELFITAVTLNCSHTFCKYCIDSWKKNKRECPICRQKITSEIKSIVLDNFIENIVSTLSETLKGQRKKLIAERKAEIEAANARLAPPVPSINRQSTTATTAGTRNTRRNTRGRGRGRGRGRNSAHSTRNNQGTQAGTSSTSVELPHRTGTRSITTTTTTSTSTNVRVLDPTPITIDSDSSVSENSVHNYSGEPSSSDESLESNSSFESGISGVYFGGYGRCYNCGRRGHWANGCPAF